MSGVTPVGLKYCVAPEIRTRSFFTYAGWAMVMSFLVDSQFATWSGIPEHRHLSTGHLFDPLAGFGEHQIDHPAQCLRFRVPLQAAQTVQIDLPVCSGPIPDDSQRMTHLCLASQRTGIERKFVDKFARVVMDIDPPAAADPVAEEGVNAVTLRDDPNGRATAPRAEARGAQGELRRCRLFYICSGTRMGV